MTRDPSTRGELAQVTDEEQLRELLREARERAQILERRLPSLRRACAQGRGDELLDERGLAVGRVAEDTQVPCADAEAHEPRADERHLGVGLGVAALACDRARRDESVLLELAGELRRDPAALAQLAEVELLLLGGERERAAAGAIGGPRRGELLADDAQREELVALHPQDRAQALELLL